MTDCAAHGQACTHGPLQSAFSPSPPLSKGHSLVSSRSWKRDCRRWRDEEASSIQIHFVPSTVSSLAPSCCPYPHPPLPSPHAHVACPPPRPHRLTRDHRVDFDGMYSERRVAACEQMKQDVTSGLRTGKLTVSPCTKPLPYFPDYKPLLFFFYSAPICAAYTQVRLIVRTIGSLSLIFNCGCSFCLTLHCVLYSSLLQTGMALTYDPAAMQNG